MTSAFSSYPRCSQRCGQKNTNNNNQLEFTMTSGNGSDKTADRQQPVYSTTTNADACSDISYTHVYGMATKENGYHQYDTTLPQFNVNDSFTGSQPNSEKQPKQTSTSITGENCICKNLLKKPNRREKMSSDRLGQWPVESDSEIAGNLSGLDRLRNGRFNKVSENLIFLTKKRTTFIKPVNY